MDNKFYKALESFFILWIKTVFSAVAVLIFFCLFAIGSCVAVSFFKETAQPHYWLARKAQELQPWDMRAFYALAAKAHVQG